MWNRPNNLLWCVPPIRVTRQMTRILDNFTQKSDLFKIYANWAQHFVKMHLAYKGNTGNDKNTGQFDTKKWFIQNLCELGSTFLWRRISPIRVTREMTRILTILHKKVIYSKFMRIRRNILLRCVPSLRVTREMTRILDNFTQKSDFIIIDNLCELGPKFC